jgi:hypothetical protein
MSRHYRGRYHRPIAGSSITVTATFPVPIERAFDVVVAEDVLPKLLHRFGPIPAVVGTSNNTGPWDRPGSKRLVHLAGGGSAREEVTDFARPDYFAYRVSEFSAPFDRLARQAVGQWWFTRVEGATKVRWTYTLFPPNRALAPVGWLFGHLLWRGYMRRAFARLAGELTAGAR